MEIQQDKVRTILSWLAGLDSGRHWTERTIEVMPTTDGVSFGVAEEAEEGPGGQSGELPPGIASEVYDLQRAMFRPNGGTWVTAQLQVTSTGSGDARFNYTDQPTTPDGEPILSPADIAAHLKAYPRPAEATPDWMRS